MDLKMDMNNPITKFCAMVAQECEKNDVELLHIGHRSKKEGNLHDQILFYTKGSTTPAMLHFSLKNMCSFVTTEVDVHEGTVCTVFACHF